MRNLRDLVLWISERRRKAISFSTAVFVGLFALFLLYNQVEKADAISYLYSDESASIIASRSIAETLLPRLPNGKLYYRDFVAHYLNGVGILFFGDSLRGCRAASLAAYFVIVLVPSLVLCLKARSAPSAVIYCLLMGLGPHLQRHACSARMYMIYMTFGTLAVLILICLACRTKRSSPCLYGAFLFLAMFSHLHFLVILPGMMAGALWMIWAQQEGSIRQYLKMGFQSPYIWLPIVVAGCGVLYYLGMKHLPNAWVNEEAVPIVFGEEPSFTYPGEILGHALVLRPSLLIAILLLYKRVKREQIFTVESSAAALVLVLAYVCISLALPLRQHRFVIVLIPLLVVFVVSLGLRSSIILTGIKCRVAAVVTCCGLLMVAAVEARYYSSGTLRAGMEEVYWREDPAFSRAVTQMKGWIHQHDAAVISTEPAVAMILFSRFDYHLRTHNVAATNPYDVVECSYSLRPFVHSANLLKQIEEQHPGIPVVIFSSVWRLSMRGTVAPSLRAYIQEHYNVVLENPEYVCYARDNGYVEPDQSSSQELCLPGQASQDAR